MTEHEKRMKALRAESDAQEARMCELLGKISDAMKETTAKMQKTTRSIGHFLGVDADLMEQVDKIVGEDDASS